MDIRDADTKELLLELNDDFTIKESHNPEAETIWLNFLDNGIVRLHATPASEKVVTSIIDDSRVVLSKDWTKNFLQIPLLQLNYILT